MYYTYSASNQEKIIAYTFSIYSFLKNKTVVIVISAIKRNMIVDK